MASAAIPGTKKRPGIASLEAAMRCKYTNFV